MPSYMQMGHDTENLVGEEELQFKGLILSPVNRYPHELATKLSGMREKGPFDIVLDSQLYFPKSDRDKLVDYPYFPSDLDTADFTSESWWSGINKKLAEFSIALGIDGVTSPAIIPKIFSDEFYLKTVDVANQLKSMLSKSNVDVLQTAIIDFNSLSSLDGVMKVASILSDTECKKVYLVFASELAPREELNGAEELFGAMKLIKELKNSGKLILVAFCSSEMPLYKCAGAFGCATGKFFNLRRFTKSRFDEPSGGGGQLPYWFEHGLLAFLRQADILRVRHKGVMQLLENGFSKSVWSEKIIEVLSQPGSKAWLAMGWRQYLSWFSRAEAELDAGNAISITSKWLSTADANWSKVDENKIFFDERKNNGEWIRSWMQTLDYFENDH